MSFEALSIFSLLANFQPPLYINLFSPCLNFHVSCFLCFNVVFFLFFLLQFLPWKLHQMNIVMKPCRSLNFFWWFKPSKDASIYRTDSKQVLVQLIHLTQLEYEKVDKELDWIVNLPVTIAITRKSTMNSLRSLCKHKAATVSQQSFFLQRPHSKSIIQNRRAWEGWLWKWREIWFSRVVLLSRHHQMALKKLGRQVTSSGLTKKYECTI